MYSTLHLLCVCVCVCSLNTYRKWVTWLHRYPTKNLLDDLERSCMSMQDCTRHWLECSSKIYLARSCKNSARFGHVSLPRFLSRILPDHAKMLQGIQQDLPMLVWQDSCQDSYQIYTMMVNFGFGLLQVRCEFEGGYNSRMASIWIYMVHMYP